MSKNVNISSCHLHVVMFLCSCRTVGGCSISAEITLSSLLRHGTNFPFGVYIHGFQCQSVLMQRIFAYQFQSSVIMGLQEHEQ